MGYDADAMNRVERLTAILLLLQDKPRTSEEIARHFEVSRRTILRDIQALSEMGVPVIAREGVGGGYSLPADYRLPPLPLTTREAFLLLLSLGALSRLSATPFAAERASLTAKLRALVPHQELDQVEQMLATVDVNVPDRAESTPFLEALMAAARERRWVRISYQSAQRLSSLHIYIRRIDLDNGYWYCRSYSAEHQADRTFRVDRIQSLAEPDLDFAPPSVPDPPEYEDESNPELVVTFTPRGAFQVQSQPFIGPRVRRNSDGSAELRMRCPTSEFDWFAGLFAGLGREACVVAPPELRRRLRDLGGLLADQYRDSDLDLGGER